MHFPRRLDSSFESLLFIRDGAILRRVDVKQILWVHSDGNYITIHTPQQKFVLKMSLKKVCEKLPTETFVRVHRSFVVQTNLIEKIDFQENKVHIGGGEIFPLGRGYKAELMGQIDLLN